MDSNQRRLAVGTTARLTSSLACAPASTVLPVTDDGEEAAVSAFIATRTAMKAAEADAEFALPSWPVVTAPLDASQIAILTTLWQAEDDYREARDALRRARGISA